MIICLVVSNKQQINREEVKETRKLLTPKRPRIRPKYSATVAFSWKEDKDGTKQTLYIKWVIRVFHKGRPHSGGGGISPLRTRRFFRCRRRTFWCKNFEFFEIYGVKFRCESVRGLPYKIAPIPGSHRLNTRLCWHTINFKKNSKCCEPKSADVHI